MNVLSHTTLKKNILSSLRIVSYYTFLLILYGGSLLRVMLRSKIVALFMDGNRKISGDGTFLLKNGSCVELLKCSQSTIEHL
jgi:hypothetical protein